MKKVLIIGSKGMLGHMILKFFKSKKCFEIKDISRNGSLFKPAFEMDVFNLKNLEKIIIDYKPHYIINCIGVLNEYAETNPDKAIFLNSYFPHFLANKFGYFSKLIHISTDCVFSGKKGNYTINDNKDGVGFYSISKAAGEVLYNNNLTIRTSIIGPEIKENGIGLLHWFLTNKNKSIKGYKSAYWSGVTTLQLAKTIHKILLDSDELSGLIHVTNNNKINKFDLLKLFKSTFNSNVNILAENSYCSDKSLVSNLDISILKIPKYSTMINELKKWMNNDKSLYRLFYDI